MVTVIGNGLAGLIAAIELGKRNVPVHYHCDLSRVGAFFQGKEIQGFHLDHGMNFLEFTSFQNQTRNSLGEYDPTIRNSCGRFVSHIREFLESLGVRSYAVPTPQTYFRGKFYDDFVISNDLQIIEGLTDEEKRTFVNELRKSLDISNPLHAKNKNHSNFSKYSYDEVSRFNHTSILHDLIITPFAEKLAKGNARHLSALYHRALWLPLYYPETLLESVQKQEWHHLSKRTTFSYPLEGSFGSIVKRCVDQLSRLPSLEIASENITPEIIESVSDKILISEFTKTLDPYFNSSALTELPKTELSVHQLIIPPEKLAKTFSAIHVVDPEIPFYRVTLQGGRKNVESKAILQVEHSLGNDLNVEEILDWLNRMEIASSLNIEDLILCQQNQFKVSIPVIHKVPMIDQFNTQVTRLSQRFSLIGNASYFGTYSFNDQIIQGLKVGFNHAKTH